MANKNMTNTENANVKVTAVKETADVEVREDFMEKANLTPKNIHSMNDEAVRNRLNKMINMRAEFIKNVDKEHVKLQNGGRKTGKNVYTVSLIPIFDCPNCDGCCTLCYDIRNVCFRTPVMRDRAKNSAIHKVNPERYWKEIGMQLVLQNVEILRINVGGDLTYEDFGYVNNMAAQHPDVTFQFFTKNYDGINKWLDENEDFESNVQAIMSVWKDMPYSNPHRIPESHLLWADGSTTAPEYGAYFCKGNCSNCKLMGEGCFALKKGECVVLSAH